MFDLLRSERGLILGWLVVLGCSGSGATTPVPDAANGSDGSGGSEVGSGGADGGGAGGADALGVSFAIDVFPIVLRSCVIGGCHDAATQQNHWNNYSTRASTYQRWSGPGFDFCVDTPEPDLQRIIVVPGDPEMSFLVMKITSTREEPCRDNHYPRMPPPQFPSLPPAEIETIVSWIREGARDN